MVRREETRFDYLDYIYFFAMASHPVPDGIIWLFVWQCWHFKDRESERRKRSAIPGFKPMTRAQALADVLHAKITLITLKVIFILLTSNSLGSSLGLHCKLSECCLALKSQQCVNSTSHTPNARCAHSLTGALALLSFFNKYIRLPDE